MASVEKIINKNGKVCFKVRIRLSGHKTVTKRFYDEDPKKAKLEAQNFAAKIELEIKNGLYIEEKENKNYLNIKTVADMINYYEKNIAPQRYSYHEKYSTMYDWWREKIGSVNLNKLTTATLTHCKNILMNEKITKGDKKVVRSANTINKYLMCLSAVLTYASKDLELIQANPMSKVSKLKKHTGRTRFLSEKEITKLLDAAKNHSDMLYLFVLLSLSTGGRYSEVRELCVENINKENSMVYFLDTKNKEHRGVSIPENVLNLLIKYMKDHDIVDGYIFINKSKNKLYYIKGMLEKVIKTADIKDFHIHDIRHTLASYTAMNGGSLLDIAEILGHKSLVMARRYSHLTQKHTTSVLYRVTQKIIPDV